MRPRAGVSPPGTRVFEDAISRDPTFARGQDGLGLYICEHFLVCESAPLSEDRVVVFPAPFGSRNPVHFAVDPLTLENRSDKD